MKLLLSTLISRDFFFLFNFQNTDVYGAITKTRKDTWSWFGIIIKFQIEKSGLTTTMMIIVFVVIHCRTLPLSSIKWTEWQKSGWPAWLTFSAAVCVWRKIEIYATSILSIGNELSHLPTIKTFTLKKMKWSTCVPWAVPSIVQA